MTGRLRTLSYLVVLCMIYAGCGSSGGGDNNNPVDAGGNDTGGTNLSPGTQAVFNDAEYTTLVNAEDLYSRLSSKYDDDTAREALLDSLATWRRCIRCSYCGRMAPLSA